MKNITKQFGKRIGGLYLYDNNDRCHAIQYYIDDNNIYQGIYTIDSKYQYKVQYANLNGVAKSIIKNIEIYKYLINDIDTMQLINKCYVYGSGNTKELLFNYIVNLHNNCMTLLKYEKEKNNNEK